MLFFKTLNKNLTNITLVLTRNMNWVCISDNLNCSMTSIISSLKRKGSSYKWPIHVVWNPITSLCNDGLLIPCHFSILVMNWVYMMLLRYLAFSLALFFYYSVPFDLHIQRFCLEFFNKPFLMNLTIILFFTCLL